MMIAHSKNYNMYYVIQENLFREYGFVALHNDLILRKLYTKNKVDFEIVKYIPFSEQLEVKTDRKDVFFFGSSNAGMVAKKKYNWTPGHFINENFTMEKYLPAFGSYMLNSDGRIRTPNELCEAIKSLHFGLHTLFIRPVGDGKEFTGEVFTGAQWLEYAENNDSLKGIRVLTASPKTTQQEIRCWMIDGEPVTISQYKIGSRANYLNMDHNDEAIIFARKMSKIFQPARAYCLDICLYNDEYYIVELGCINHCGFYDANMGKLIDGLEKMKF
jgi:hypothetical protein